MQSDIEQVAEPTPEGLPTRRSAKSLLLEGLLLILPIAMVYWLEYKVFMRAIDFGAVVYGIVLLAALPLQAFPKRKRAVDPKLQGVLQGLSLLLWAIVLWQTWRPYLLLHYHMLVLLIVAPIAGWVDRICLKRYGRIITTGATLFIAILLLVVSLIFLAMLRPATVAQAQEHLRQRGEHVLGLESSLDTNLALSICELEPYRGERVGQRDLGVYLFVVERGGEQWDVFYGLLQHEVLAERRSE